MRHGETLAACKLMVQQLQIRVVKSVMIQKETSSMKLARQSCRVDYRSG